MAYSEPIGPSYPRYTLSIRHQPIQGDYPLTLQISHAANDELDADADAIIQKAVDTLTTAGFEVLEATKRYEFRQSITVTPPA
ncbi:hypothetical protein [Streptomyces sp. NBC_00258]|uniref:hypothetical protein n=1 Tax=Streptomyces sp. NBC_00258 TaxID=2903642 RepID=UPI002E2A848C|nr:hypothetical protein [Streptomyces sp. NBC_00258]